MIINSYFPTDSGLLQINEAELDEIFVEIENIIENTEFTTFILVGDINADFVRRSGHVQAVSHFICNMNVVSAWDKFEIDYTHIYEVRNQTVTSTIDHLFWSEPLNGAVVDANVIHSIENPSDHCPVYCVIDELKLSKSKVNSLRSKPKPSWKKASDEQKQTFKIMVSQKLSDIIVPSGIAACSNVKCDDFHHTELIDSYVETVLKVVNDISYECLPTPTIGHK